MPIRQADYQQERCHASHRKNAIETAGPMICDRCCRINFEEAIDSLGSDDGTVTWRLVAEMKGLDPSCALCQLFSEMILPGTYLAMPTRDPWKLRALRIKYMACIPNQSSYYFRGIPRVALYAGSGERDYFKHLDSDVVMERGLLYAARTKDMQEHDSIAKTKDVPKTQFTSPRYFPDLVRRWVEISDDTENPELNLDAKMTPTKAPAFAHDINVIDCESLEIINYTAEMEYVALSYVWRLANVDLVSSGRPTMEAHRACGRFLPLTIPRVVHNAMTVTKDIGYRYLWVDQYCIDQSAPKEVINKHVSQMNLIYSEAKVTIIAASTQGALPGVGSTRRDPQKVLITKGHTGRDGSGITLFTTKPAIDDAIVNSVWSTRGWCFQEAVLSPRRLFFTDQEIYFESRDMWCSESYPEPKALLQGLLYSKSFQSLSLEGNSWLALLKSRGAESEFDLNDLRGLFWAELGIFLDLVEAYSKKQMTLSSDVLNGFRGIMGNFSRRNPSFQTLQGMPIFDPLAKKTEPSETSQSLELGCFQERSFVSVLGWQNFGSKRRAGFPSWSWACKMGTPSWPYVPHEIYGDNVMGELTLHIRAVESTSGQVVDLSHAPTYFQGSEEPIFLHGETIEVPVKRLMLGNVWSRRFFDSKVTKLYRRYSSLKKWLINKKDRVWYKGRSTKMNHGTMISGSRKLSKILRWSRLKACFAQETWYIHWWRWDARELYGVEIRQRLDDGRWSILLMHKAPGRADGMIVSWDTHQGSESRNAHELKPCSRVGLAQVLNSSQSGRLFTEDNPNLDTILFRLG